MKDHSSFLDLALDGDALGYDPLGAFDDEDEDEEGPFAPPRPIEDAPATDERPAEERIDALFSSMAPRRKTLLGMIAFCAAPQPTEALDAEVERLQADNHSVYSPASLANLLERAGALVRVTAAGDAYPADDPEPRLVEVDGASYYEAAEVPAVHWLATPEGAAFVAADAPLERLRELLRADGRYAPVYERLLALCAQEDGATVAALGKAVNDDELLKSPRLLAPHFIEKLERCDAVAWKGRWQITEIGRAGLAMLAETDGSSDDGAAPGGGPAADTPGDGPAVV